MTLDTFDTVSMRSTSNPSEIQGQSRSTSGHVTFSIHPAPNQQIQPINHKIRTIETESIPQWISRNGMKRESMDERTDGGIGPISAGDLTD